MNTERLFEANFHWSNEIIITTIIFMVVMIVVVVSLWIKPVSPYFRYPLTAFMIGLNIYFTSLTPIKLSLNTDEITVKKLIGSIDIPINEIESVSLASNITNNSIRLFASGGVCGYLGLFKNDMIGRYEMYATEMKDLVLIKTKDKSYVFNCKNPETLISIFNSLKNTPKSTTEI